MVLFPFPFFFFSSRRRHTRWPRDWSSDVCSSDLEPHDLPLRLPFRIKIRSPFPAAEGQPGQAVFESLLKRKKLYDTRSEERRVGKECRYGWGRGQEKKEIEIKE